MHETDNSGAVLKPSLVLCGQLFLFHFDFWIAIPTCKWDQMSSKNNDNDENTSQQKKATVQ